ncbi:Dot/Icm T4SS effector AnkI/LegAS4 [Legionella maioricensis]|uniref:SET domain-containing protein-lysine N-methyltransferase n=1 Tax=Legionella maioricensis TaxID=2896528 RepID=A0A9X2D085_9GAMM|nr:Dot/Icm T4SS effector AnkI/LegAS4 [Legionella maioricensis]MCL9683700.1 SET domain-containing protein-lysine N-methyltransferase [Legionella maioricensis]MCL9687474.1 SET domain-containing protein-lysine N-methyltransferase [Legionella maioricensis]
MPKQSERTKPIRTRKAPAFLKDYETNFPIKKALQNTVKTVSSKATSSVKFKKTQGRKKSVIVPQSFFSLPKVRKVSKNDSVTNWARIVRELGIDNMETKDYIPSDLDKSGWVSVKSVNLLSKHGGRGLFAEQDIPAGTCIGVYTGEVYSSQQEFNEYLATHIGTDNSYAMSIGGRVIDAAKKGNFTRYINFSDSQDNVEFVEGIFNGHKVVKVKTTKEISKGQQLLVNYNTYDERASKLYYFLNPCDGWQSAAELYEEHSVLYQLIKTPFSSNLFKLRKNCNLYVTSMGKAILEGKIISGKEELPDAESVNLPFLKSNSTKAVLGFDVADAFTPLMLACYLGQLENVELLIGLNANIDQQQNHSGNCALFFALEGYAAASDSTTPFLKIMQLLIKKQANIFVHDRADRTFLHSAVSVLSDKDFKTIMILIKKQGHIDFAHLFDYVDEDDCDIFMSCLKDKSFVKTRILLDLFPTYFKENSSRQKKLFCNVAYKKAIEDYDEGEKAILLKLLGNKKYTVPSAFLEALAPEEENDYSDESSFSVG